MVPESETYRPYKTLTYLDYFYIAWRGYSPIYPRAPRARRKAPKDRVDIVDRLDKSNKGRAGPQIRLAESDAAKAARAAACSYRERMADFAEMRSLEVWCDAIDTDRFAKEVDSEERR